MSDPLNSTDAYSEALATQNAGGFCQHCNSTSGHFRNCPLICRATAEAHSAERSEADHLILHALGVKW